MPFAACHPSSLSPFPVYPLSLYNKAPTKIIFKKENVDGNAKIRKHFKLAKTFLRSLEVVFAFFEKELMRKMGDGNCFAE